MGICMDAESSEVQSFSKPHQTSSHIKLMRKALRTDYHSPRLESQDSDFYNFTSKKSGTIAEESDD